MSGHVNNLMHTYLNDEILYIHNETQQKYSNISSLLRILKAQSIH